jgi:hypothetical protein
VRNAAENGEEEGEGDSSWRSLSTPTSTSFSIPFQDDIMLFYIIRKLLE